MTTFGHTFKPITRHYLDKLHLLYVQHVDVLHRFQSIHEFFKQSRVTDIIGLVSLVPEIKLRIPFLESENLLSRIQQHRTVKNLSF